MPPLTLAYGAGGSYWSLYNEDAWQPDRRKVPAQRQYVSDPSFYPTVPPLDPLTVAYGAGGAYWQLYNTAALDVGRREVPQQRLYLSAAGLLDTALLEDALLGYADARRHQQAAAFTDRREVPQQRPYVSDPALLLAALLENELLGGADDHTRRYAIAATHARPANVARARPPAALPDIPADPLNLLGDVLRRLTTATHADRRQTAAQPARQTLYFDAGPGDPPLTLAWGAGGNIWHLYNDAAGRRIPIRTWQLVSPLFVGVPPRDLVLRAGAAELDWRAGPPYLASDLRPPNTTWHAGPPYLAVTSWSARTTWRSGPPNAL